MHGNTFECKSVLKLRIPKQENVMGLSWGVYDVTECFYKFHQNLSRTGEVCSGLKDGMIEVALTGKPTDELMGWIFDPMKKYNGEITVMDMSGETLEQIYFEEARCVDLSFCYKAGSTPVTTTHLKIIAKTIQIGEAYFEEMNQ